MTARQRRYLQARWRFERPLAALLLVGLLPLLSLVALLTVLSSPGPALFVQWRAGQHNRPFRIYKFRTMRVGAPQLSTRAMRARHENVITPFGALLRRSSLDELPQLINVVRGEMSLIGPRPMALIETDILLLRSRQGVTALLPGLTGLAQVSGRDLLTDEEKVAQDVTYLRRAGWWADLRICLLTVRRVLDAHGSH